MGPVSQLELMNHQDDWGETCRGVAELPAVGISGRGEGFKEVSEGGGLLPCVA